MNYYNIKFAWIYQHFCCGLNLFITTFYYDLEVYKK